MAKLQDSESPWAHAPTADSGLAPHLLVDHLRAVSDLSGQFAGQRGGEWAALAGLWHDLGKRRRDFQVYIRQRGGSEAHIEGRVADRDKTHSAAGALWAARALEQQWGAKGLLLSRMLQYVIAGHHAGLDNWTGLAARLTGNDAQREYADAIGQAQPQDGILHPQLPPPDARRLPTLDERNSGEPGRMALWIRMLFSALVDADFLDTEAYFDPSIPARRQAPHDLASLKAACDAHLSRLGSSAAGDVNLWRAHVLLQSRKAASQPPGVFSLTVPTGGGKTLSSLAFALDHATRHGQRRIVYAIPYTSIIEQTADVFRDVFASLGEDVVIEHHSNAEADPTQENHRSRLACENWDAPLIVTTNVQLFESLFANRTSRCRKLHNLADSVIVLDEAQLLPVGFLQPIVDVLRYLVRDFGVTVLLCTATQPLLDAQAGADPSRGLRRGIGTVTEIIDDVPGLFQALERVTVRLPPNLAAPRTWADLAQEMASHEALLAIVNRRADAAELYRLLKAHGDGHGSGPWHLSALMCAQHRSDTIAEIKAALQARRDALAQGLPAAAVRVVSTQLVEAGVDLDFPVVYRAIAGLDSIAQAAGRCNREGRLPQKGEVHVFVPPSKSPPGLLSLARQISCKVLHDLPASPLALERVARYFKLLLHDVHSTDEKQICELLKLEIDPGARSMAVQFRDAATAFKLIDDQDSATILVRYHSPNARDDINQMIDLLEREGPTRWLMRKLQRYGVSLPAREARRLAATGDIQEVGSCPGLFAQTADWDGFYDPFLGVRADSAPGDPLIA